MLLPIRDECSRPNAFPVVVVGLIGINVIVFLYEFLLMSSSDRAINSFIFHYGMIPEAVTTGEPGAIFTMFTNLFIHGGFFHLLGNMLFLWIFGDNVEDILGSIPFIIFYFLCGIGADIGHILMGPNSAIPSIGASGAISGVLAAYIRYFPRNRITNFFWIYFQAGFFQLRAVYYIALWFLMQIFFSALAGSSSGIAYGAHIGGFITGLIIIHLFPKRREAIEYYRVSHMHEEEE